MSGSIQNTYTLIPQYKVNIQYHLLIFHTLTASMTYKKVSTKEISIDVIRANPK